MSMSSDSSDVEAGKDEMSFAFRSNQDSKCFRLFTVFMYVGMVSGLGLMLSAYHFFVWDSTMPPVAQIPGHEVY